MDIFHFITLAVDVIEIKRGLNGDGSSATVCRTRHLLVFCASLSDERFSVDGGWMTGNDCDSHNPIFHRELYIVLLANVLKRISSSLSSSCGCCWTNQPASQQTKLTPQSTQNIDKIGTCWRSCGSLGIVNDAYYLLASSAVSRHKASYAATVRRDVKQVIVKERQEGEEERACRGVTLGTHRVADPMK